VEREFLRPGRVVAQLRAAADGVARDRRDLGVGEIDLAARLAFNPEAVT